MYYEATQTKGIIIHVTAAGTFPPVTSECDATQHTRDVCLLGEKQAAKHQRGAAF